MYCRYAEGNLTHSICSNGGALLIRWAVCRQILCNWRFKADTFDKLATTASDKRVSLFYWMVDRAPDYLAPQSADQNLSGC